MIKTLATILASAVLALTAMLAVVTQEKVAPVFGSVSEYNEYNSTTTAASIATKPSIWSLTATSSTDTTSHSGGFGSFIQTEAAATLGHLDIYDATTTNVNQRTNNLATSSILLASLPTNATVGTYTFDSKFSNGLIVVSSGGAGTTTLTYRITR